MYALCMKGPFLLYSLDSRARPVPSVGWRRHKNKRIKKADALNDTLLTVLHILIPLATLWTLYHLHVLFPNSKPQTSLSNLSQLPFQLTPPAYLFLIACGYPVTFLCLLLFSWFVISTFLLSPSFPYASVSVLTRSRTQTWINPAIC